MAKEGEKPCIVEEQELQFFSGTPKEARALGRKNELGRKSVWVAKDIQ